MFAICDEHANERAGEVPESVNSEWLDHSFLDRLQTPAGDSSAVQPVEVLLL